MVLSPMQDAIQETYYIVIGVPTFLSLWRSNIVAGHGELVQRNQKLAIERLIMVVGLHAIVHHIGAQYMDVNMLHRGT